MKKLKIKEGVLSSTCRAPKCPKCGAPLTLVIVESAGEHLLWNEENDGYEHDDSQQQLTYVCGECGEAIGGWRADGEECGFIPETN